ncbi:MAG: arginine repressor [Acidaminococcus sp.]|jgi:transcriptional regulator of arginine metabolism|nr:arginine repressor [Acidaminococcus sp.]MCI2099407.1 arginine repressor [Acidaminococcus sp.]MCI2113767.1 arginine repressor [Acidaminococcus sp.]MCI2115659.1 arginine repressor [Acidaminococcus sp.]
MKLSRQEAIKQIIKTQTIETQSDLAEALKKAGFNVTQATVSRDIKDMFLIKIPDEDGRYKYCFPTEQNQMITPERLRDMLRSYTLTLNTSENLIVLHTLPGMAPAVAYALDHLSWSEVLGTVAGDDTILIVVDNRDHIEQVKTRILQKKG